MSTPDQLFLFDESGQEQEELIPREWKSSELLAHWLSKWSLERHFPKLTFTLFDGRKGYTGIVEAGPEHWSQFLATADLDSLMRARMSAESQQIEERYRDPNPEIQVCGRGPEGKTCGECVHLIGICHARTYWKCKMRTITNGPKTDHKRRWNACSQFEQRNGDIPLYDGR